jgi:hypothetical protein
MAIAGGFLWLSEMSNAHQINLRLQTRKEENQEETTGAGKIVPGHGRPRWQIIWQLLDLGDKVWIVM